MGLTTESTHLNHQMPLGYMEITAIQIVLLRFKEAAERTKKHLEKITEA